MTLGLIVGRHKIKQMEPANEDVILVTALEYEQLVLFHFYFYTNRVIKKFQHKEEGKKVN